MTGLRFVLALAVRESRAAGRRLLLLTATISIGVGALVAVESFADNLRVAVDGQSRSLLGGDLAMRSRHRPSATFRATLDSVIRAAGADSVRDVAEVVSFAGMAYVPRTGGARLVRVSAVRGGYPFYGVVRTDPADRWEALARGRSTLVDPSFLTTFGAAVGDTMALGESRFVITGTVTSFPGDVGIRSAFGPRVFIPGAFLAETELLTFGSRAEYDWYVRTPPGTDTRALTRTWKPRLRALQGGLRSAADEERELTQSLDQMGRYLGLVALVALLLGGIGVASAVQVFLRRKRDTIAILRCLGATSRQVFGVYLLQAAAMGLAGSAAGALLGGLFTLAMPRIFGAFLPLQVAVHPSARAVLTGLGAGFWVALVFAVLPLLSARRVPPLAVLRRDVDQTVRLPADLPAWAARAGLALSVVGLAVLQVGRPLQGLAFAAGGAAALGILWLAAFGLTRALRRWFPSRLPYVFRQGLANLYRPANQTVTVVLALGFGAFLLGAVAVMQHNLLQSFRLDSGPAQPNVVLFDIQPGQRAPLELLLREDGLAVTSRVPIVPMRLSSINGRAVAALLADSSRRINRDGDTIEPWALRREYRSTYRDTSVPSEHLVVGAWWPAGGDRAPGATVPVSLEVGIASDLGVTVRDTLTWDVQGVPVPTVVANLREVNWARFEPNFFVVFPAGPLDRAPQSWVMLTRVPDPAGLGRLQRRVVERFPNVTSVDLSAVRRTIEDVVGQVALAVRFMALFTLATGVVVLVGALTTSQFQRVREAALLKTLGASRRQVVQVLLTEYAALGLLAALVAAGLATAGGWALARWLFEVPFDVPWLAFAGLAALLVALPVATGLGSSIAIFRRSPLEVLRSE